MEYPHETTQQEMEDIFEDDLLQKIDDNYISRTELLNFLQQIIKRGVGKYKLLKSLKNYICHTQGVDGPKSSYWKSYKKNGVWTTECGACGVETDVLWRYCPICGSYNPYESTPLKNITTRKADL